MQTLAWILAGLGALFCALPLAAVRKAQYRHRRLRTGTVTTFVAAGTILLVMSLGWYVLPATLLTPAALPLRNLSIRSRLPTPKSTAWAMETPTHKNPATRDLLNIPGCCGEGTIGRSRPTRAHRYR
ncbi:hypothetical protein [Streptomyces sp. CA-106110]|uniref:hypothetical protein n=1 Tax=Streptomyces sp. CA-106110 TaxID=3240044 RepID=UPI003D8D558C